MQTVISYFEQIPSWQRALIIASGIAFFWIIEIIVPLFAFQYNKWKHAGINLFFTFTTVFVNLLFAFLLVQSSSFVSKHNIGVINWIELPLWAEVLVAVLLLDLVGAYLIHLIQHQVKWMWKFHLIHHADTHVDTTTANRHHPVESIFRALFTIIAVWVTGAGIGVIMLYQSMSVVISQFNHANIRLPVFIDKAISWIIVSPNMHKVHHHFTRPHTDSNYGNIFSLWDRIFGTFLTKKPVDIEYGVDVLNDLGDESIPGQLKLPFKKI